MPKLCRCCKGYGHITETCQEVKRCDVCSDKHETLNCTRAQFCWNCNGNHKPISKECPCYVQEKRIIKIQVDRKVSPRYARSIYKDEAAHRYIELPNELITTEIDDDESDIEEQITTEPIRMDTRSKAIATNGEDEELELAGEDALGHPLMVPAITQQEKPDQEDSNPVTKDQEGREELTDDSLVEFVDLEDDMIEDTPVVTNKKAAKKAKRQREKGNKEDEIETGTRDTELSESGNLRGKNENDQMNTPSSSKKRAKKAKSALEVEEVEMVMREAARRESLDQEAIL